MEAPGVEGGMASGILGDSRVVSFPSPRDFRLSHGDDGRPGAVSCTLVTAGCSNVVSAEAVSETLARALRAWAETRDPRLVRRLLLEALQALEDGE